MGKTFTGTRDVKKEHYRLGILLTEKKKEEILKDVFLRRLGYELDLENPKTYNEKIMWYKLYYQDSLITKCADKYRVKEYVKEILGDGYTVPTIAKWDKPEDINFDELPQQFVLKVNWSSGYNIIVQDKSKINIEKIRKQLCSWIQPDRNSYYQFFNWGYKYMKPVIYAENYIEQLNGQLYDYKFLVFNGKVKSLLICTDRSKDIAVTYDFFDRDFNHLPFTSGGGRHASPLPEKPYNYERMIQLAEKLAEPFPLVRVDFYEINKKIYIGEMTFYPGGGLLAVTPREWDYKMGEWIHLPDKKIIDVPGSLYPIHLAAAQVWDKTKNGLHRIRRKVIRHDRINKKHYFTLFGHLRLQVASRTERGIHLASIKAIDWIYKKPLLKSNRTSLFSANWSFKPYPPEFAYALEEKITLDIKKHYCEQKAYKQLQYFPNLDAPRSFNEKLLWLALNYKNPQHAIASDKYKSKGWIANKIGSQYVVPLLGAYDNVNDIDFSALPDRFVMKANEGWAANSVIIVDDKSRFDVNKLKAIASTWLYPWSSYYYNNMCITDEKPEKPMIIIEPYLQDGERPYLDDFKLYCCNGEVKFALIVTDRGSKHQTRTFVDRNWNVLPVNRAGKQSTTTPDRPDNMDEMMRLAEILSKDFPLVRVDFYNVSGQIYVGEMTFTPGLFLKFNPTSWDYNLGEYLDISELIKEKSREE